MYDEAGRYPVKLHPTLTSADADGENDDGDVKGKIQQQQMMVMTIPKEKGLFH
jgi:hypothetical protein